MILDLSDVKKMNKYYKYSTTIKKTSEIYTVINVPHAFFLSQMFNWAAFVSKIVYAFKFLPYELSQEISLYQVHILHSLSEKLDF